MLHHWVFGEPQHFTVSNLQARVTLDGERAYPCNGSSIHARTADMGGVSFPARPQHLGRRKCILLIFIYKDIHGSSASGGDMVLNYVPPPSKQQLSWIRRWPLLQLREGRDRLWGHSHLQMLLPDSAGRYVGVLAGVGVCLQCLCMLEAHLGNAEGMGGS